MILILTGKEDMSTLSVANWIKQLGRQVMIVSDKDKIENVVIENGKTLLQFSDGRKLDFAQIGAYWYRRGFFAFSAESDPDAPDEVAKQLNDELDAITGLLHARLQGLPSLSSQLNAKVNRMTVMDRAAALGLNVPAFGVYNSRQAVADFAGKHGKIVTKPISNGLTLQDEAYSYLQYTTLLTPQDLEVLPARFFPGLFCAYVAKKYELRIFYLDGICYTMAVLSQTDQQTSVDMRRYNYQKPNRNLPYRLPEGVSEGIHQLMNSLQLKTGSIDMIVTPEDEFIFLEVNPIGQFGNVSENCNYNLPLRVAEYLIQIST